MELWKILNKINESLFEYSPYKFGFKINGCFDIYGWVEFKEKNEWDVEPKTPQFYLFLRIKNEQLGTNIFSAHLYSPLRSKRPCPHHFKLKVCILKVFEIQNTINPTLY